MSIDQSKTNLLVHFDQIMVNLLEKNSGIFIGTNLQYGWNSHNKTNASVNNILGDYNNLYENINVVYDNDFMDMPIEDRGVIIDKK